MRADKDAEALLLPADIDIEFGQIQQARFFHFRFLVGDNTGLMEHRLQRRHTVVLWIGASGTDATQYSMYNQYHAERMLVFSVELESSGAKAVGIPYANNDGRYVLTASSTLRPSRGMNDGQGVADGLK